MGTTSITKCRICGEKLEDPKSVANGIGPVCAKKKQKYLSSCGVTDAEVTEMVATGEVEVLKWIRVAFLALGKRRLSEAKAFFNQARREAQLA